MICASFARPVGLFDNVFNRFVTWLTYHLYTMFKNAGSYYKSMYDYSMRENNNHFWRFKILRK